MGVDEIITLEDGKEYILLSQVLINDDKYFLAVEAVNNLPTENYTLYKETTDDGELAVEEVENKDLINQLILGLEKNYDEKYLRDV